MSAEHDDALDDEVLRQVVSELRRPVRLDPSLDRRALDQIRAEATLRMAPRPDRRWRAWLAGAAVAAGVGLAVVLPDQQRPAGAPASPVTVEQGEASSDARSVRLRLAAPASSRVAVVGDFN